MHAISQRPTPSPEREKQIPKSTFLEPGREAATALGSGVAVGRGQVQEAVEPLVQELGRPHP